MFMASESEWTYNVITMCCSVILIIGTILMLTIRKLYCTPAADLTSIHPPIKLFAIGEMTCYVLSYIFVSLTDGKFQFGSVCHQIFYGFFVFWLIIGIICSYLFLVYRFYYTFLGSTFEMKKRSAYCHAFVVISIPTYVVVSLYCYYVQRFTMLMMSLIYGLGLTCIAYSSLIYGFNRNLFKLVLKQRQETSSSVNQNSNRNRPSLESQKESSSLNTHQLFMIKQMTKQTLLGSLRVFCILILVLICIVLYTTTLPDVDLGTDIDEMEEQRRLRVTIIFSWLATVTIIAGVICVYLGFVFNAKTYHCVCGKCHVKCQRFCENMAEKRIQNLEDSERRESVRSMSPQRLESYPSHFGRKESNFDVDSPMSVVSTPRTSTFCDLQIGTSTNTADNASKNSIPLETPNSEEIFVGDIDGFNEIELEIVADDQELSERP